jgi:hypothetical protein
VDVADNPALTGSTTVDAVCRDGGGSEQNDSFAAASAPLPSPAPLQTLCAGDDDWFRVDVPASGEARIAIAPTTASGLRVRLVDPSGVEVPGTVSAPAGPGQALLIEKTGLTPGTYRLHVLAAPASEGDYCVDTAHMPGQQCSADPPVDS